jgi:hypothetical protein
MNPDDERNRGFRDGANNCPLPETAYSEYYYYGWMAGRAASDRGEIERRSET